MTVMTAIQDRAIPIIGTIIKIRLYLLYLNTQPLLSLRNHSSHALHTQEEPYAWGNPAALYTPQLDAKSTKIAAAAWRWRCSIGADSGCGGDQHPQQQQQYQQRCPFDSMVAALLHGKKERIEAFTRLIEAGGGQVITAR